MSSASKPTDTLKLLVEDATYATYSLQRERERERERDRERERKRERKREKERERRDLALVCCFLTIVCVRVVCRRVSHLDDAVLVPTISRGTRPLDPFQYTESVFPLLPLAISHLNQALKVLAAQDQSDYNCSYERTSWTNYQGGRIDSTNLKVERSLVLGLALFSNIET